MMIVAPEHIKIFQLGAKGEIDVDPLTKVYDDYALLPAIRRSTKLLVLHWRGVTTHHAENDKEYVIFASGFSILADKTTSIVAYVVEDTTEIEWNDDEFSNYLVFKPDAY